MTLYRKCLTWLVFASYLFANTLAASLHDHHACCGHSASADGSPTGHQHTGHCHWGHRHTSHNPARASVADHAGAELRAPHHCFVCEFFAQAPLTPPAAELIPGGDLLLDESSFSGLLLVHRAARTHLPRGPPALV